MATCSADVPVGSQLSGAKLSEVLQVLELLSIRSLLSGSHPGRRRLHWHCVSLLGHVSQDLHLTRDAHQRQPLHTGLSHTSR